VFRDGAEVKGKIERRLARYLNRSDADLARHTAVVTFTLDDAYSGACSIGSEIIEKAGGRATYYVCGGFDQLRSGNGKYHSAAELRRLQAGGHEIACHGFDHLNYQAAGSDDIHRDLELNSRYFQEIGIKSPRNFAYPYGCVSPRVKKDCAGRFRSLRGVQPGTNKGRVDLSLLKAVPLYSSRLNTAKVETMVRQARFGGGWLIFFGHEVTTEPNSFDMTPELLSCAVSAAADNEIPILTVNAALDHYRL
jgi:peptidoglycan/xylan/chitin deacetylase (PgdA/CDA1 family)